MATIGGSRWLVHSWLKSYTCIYCNTLSLPSSSSLALSLSPHPSSLSPPHNHSPPPPPPSPNPHSIPSSPQSPSLSPSRTYTHISLTNNWRGYLHIFCTGVSRNPSREMSCRFLSNLQLCQKDGMRRNSMKMVDTVTHQLIVPSPRAENHTLHPTGTLASRDSYSGI